ncbi:MAG: NUDIX domain-containing protein [Anaerolineae bacterium]|nr:NUDIX domain-containing protein [Anaerolineae bacterium]
MVGHFLGGIAALLWNPDDDTYLLLRRAAARDFGAGNWECITGRVDQGEGFEAALRREVQEEIGVAVNVEFFVGTTHFWRGDRTPENELIGVIFCCTLDGDRDAIRLTHEHDEARWCTVDEAAALLAAQDENLSEHWLLRLLRRAEALRALMPEELRAFHRLLGFETN